MFYVNYIKPRYTNMDISELDKLQQNHLFGQGTSGCLNRNHKVHSQAW